MKKGLASLFCFLIVCSVFSVSAYAYAEEPEFVRQTVEYLDDGSYYVETVHESNSLARTGKSGTKTAQYHSASGSLIYAVTVNGTFIYNGYGSSATSASATVSIYASNTSFNGKDAYTSGASAVATGSVISSGITLRKTVTLTCDKNGNLS